jgi:hypothetical protein
MKFVIIASFMVRIFPMRKFRPGGVYHLATSAKLYSKIVQNYCIICNFDR